mmetsp:Transcript_56016/g.149432  ORF Transcript_56016/g.149432 Transcript_56016/m.149432 type:complete len:370 (+) Transcript_56016:284-1393(+)
MGALSSIDLPNFIGRRLWCILQRNCRTRRQPPSKILPRDFRDRFISCGGTSGRRRASFESLPFYEFLGEHQHFCLLPCPPRAFQPCKATRLDSQCSANKLQQVVNFALSRFGALGTAEQKPLISEVSTFFALQTTNHEHQMMRSPEVAQIPASSRRIVWADLGLLHAPRKLHNYFLPLVAVIEPPPDRRIVTASHNPCKVERRCSEAFCISKLLLTVRRVKEPGSIGLVSPPGPPALFAIVVALPGGVVLKEPRGTRLITEPRSPVLVEITPPRCTLPRQEQIVCFARYPGTRFRHSLQLHQLRGQRLYLRYSQLVQQYNGAHVQVEPLQYFHFSLCQALFTLGFLPGVLQRPALGRNSFRRLAHCKQS